MAKRKKKMDPIKLKVKPVWKLAKGHASALPGAGLHQDPRTKRKRTRQTRNRAAIEDQQND